MLVKFVEFYGPGMSDLSFADRATLSKYGSRIWSDLRFFPIDKATIDYLEFSARDKETVELVEAYAKEQGLWAEANDPDPVFSSTVELDISTVEPCISGPKRPQDKILLSSGADSFGKTLNEMFKVPCRRIWKR